MTSRKYIFTIAGIIILAIVVYLLFFRNQKSEMITVKVKKGSFPIEVTTTGELLAKNSDKIYGPQNLRQLGIFQVKIQDIIPDGTVVDSGQYVATLDRTEIATKMKDEETNLEKFETQLIKTKLDTSLELRGARDELVNLKYSVEEKKIAVEQSKYEPPATIRQVQIDFERAERTLDQKEKNYKLQLQKAVASVQEVNASYEQARRKLEQMAEVMKQFTIYAPKSGMVIYRRDYSGNRIGIGQTISFWDNVIAELPNLAVMISKTYVNEIDISKIRLNQSVKIGIDAFPDKKFTGKVIEMANVGEQLQNSNAKVYEVRIQVNEFDSILRPAMTTKNTILISEIDSVLFLPIESVFSNDTLSYVFRKDGGSIYRQQVILGQSNDNEIIIEEGLKEDDEVLMNMPEAPEKTSLKLLPKEILDKYEIKKTVDTLPAPQKRKEMPNGPPQGKMPGKETRTKR